MPFDPAATNVREGWGVNANTFGVPNAGLFSNQDLVTLIGGKQTKVVTDLYVTIDRNIGQYGLGKTDIANLVACRVLIVQGRLYDDPANINMDSTSAVYPEGLNVIFEARLGEFGSHHFHWNDKTGPTAKHQWLTVIALKPLAMIAEERTPSAGVKGGFIGATPGYTVGVYGYELTEG